MDLTNVEISEDGHSIMLTLHSDDKEKVKRNYEKAYKHIGVDVIKIMYDPAPSKNDVRLD
jgi:hypothetical protein